jgi:hypothetical protein
MEVAQDREGRVAQARVLRDQGLLLREVAAEMSVAVTTVHGWLSDPDGAKLKARKASYSVRCRDCGGPAYGVGYYPATRCAVCERRRSHAQRHWTRRRVKVALVRWASELGRSPTAEETQMAGTRVPYSAIQREFGTFNAALSAAKLSVRQPGQRAGQNQAGEGDGWARDLDDRFNVPVRGRWRYQLPVLDRRLKRPALKPVALTRLRVEWIAARVTLYDFAGRRCCSRSIALRRACTLHELIVILCAAVGFSDTEHLYKLSLPSGRYAAPYLASQEGALSTAGITLHELALGAGDRFSVVYDMGDYWQFDGRFQTIPAAIAPALAAHARSTDTPAIQHAAQGTAPKQYPHASNDR